MRWCSATRALATSSSSGPARTTVPAAWRRGWAHPLMPKGVGEVPLPSLASLQLSGSDPACSIDVAESAELAWGALAPVIKQAVASFLSFRADVVTAVPDVLVSGASALPEVFRLDLARGAHRLRRAFPRLSRRVASIEHDSASDCVLICVSSGGVHESPLFDLVLATSRRVHFEEVHRVYRADDDSVRHEVAVDVRSIVRQLGRGLRGTGSASPVPAVT